MVGIKDSEMSTCCTNSSFEHCQFYDICRHRETIRANYKPNDCPLVEAIPKSDYENRLKADLVAMLTEIQLEIGELDSRAGYSRDGMPTFSTDYIRKKRVNELIQQKINTLKETKDGENNY